MEANCKACGEGFLELKNETRVIIELDVYEFHIPTSFLSCTVCGASIIPSSVRKEYRSELTLKRKALYYN